jgi:hypothetical protein
MSRKNCDTNAYELLFTIGLACYYDLIKNCIETYEDIKSILDNFSIMDYKNVIIQNKQKYIEYALKINEKDSLHYILVLFKELDTLPKMPITKIYLCGKKELSEIEEVNKGLHKNERKGDVYAELDNDKFIAFSVKQNKKCTKTNWSIEKLIDHNNELNILRKKYLLDSGYPKHNREKRSEVNALFYDSDNPYFKKLREMIELNKDIIVSEFKNKLYGNVKYPYDLYEFDSHNLTNLSSITINDISFEEYMPYYYDITGKRRQCAKLFYKLKINNNIYRIEVRWKGNIHSASPQFQTHPH